MTQSFVEKEHTRSSGQRRIASDKSILKLVDALHGYNTGSSWKLDVLESEPVDGWGPGTVSLKPVEKHLNIYRDLKEVVDHWKDSDGFSHYEAALFVLITAVLREYENTQKIT